MSDDIQVPNKQDSKPALKSALAEQADPNLEGVKLLQEKELREKELALKERELELRREQEVHERGIRDRELQLKLDEFTLQREQSWWAKWSTPAVAAILAGLIGYIGTLISTWQNRQLENDRQEATLQLEREKQEGTLILEAIKTAGTAEERDRLTAANLAFLADAGLITSIKKEELDKLRAKAGSAVPSLPAPAAQNVDFTPSSLLTSQLQSRLQAALSDYQDYLLTTIGYDASHSRNRVTIRIDQEVDGNAFFDFNDSAVVLGPNLARDPEYALSEYAWHVLKEVNRQAAQVLLNTESPQFHGFAQGLKYYLTCSYIKEPYVGKNFSILTGRPTPRGTNYLYNLDNSLTFTGQEAGPHQLGEVWGGAFWEIRKRFGRDKVDQWAFTTWKRLKPTSLELNKPKYYVDMFVQTVKADDGDVSADLCREIFKRRRLG